MVGLLGQFGDAVDEGDRGGEVVELPLPLDCAVGGAPPLELGEARLDLGVAEEATRRKVSLAAPGRVQSVA